MRKRTRRISGSSPELSGKRLSSTIIQVPLRLTSGRFLAKYSGTTGIFSSITYCQMSNSVQFDRGNTPDLFRLRLMRVLNKFQSSGRWLLGDPRRRPGDRKEKMRSFGATLILRHGERRRTPRRNLKLIERFFLKASVFIT